MIEIEPELKQELHAALRADGSNMKEWFVREARGFLRLRERQLPLSLDDSDPSSVKQK